MQGLVEEGNELLEEDADPEVMDAALIVAAQKIEHYEIASYGSVCTFGRVLGYDDATEILKETLAEEERTDQLLTGVAQKLNPKAESADEADESVNQSSGNEMAGLENEPRGGGGRVGANRMRGQARGGSGGGRGQRSSRARPQGSVGQRLSARSGAKSRKATGARR